MKAQFTGETLGLTVLQQCMPVITACCWVWAGRGRCCFPYDPKAPEQQRPKSLEGQVPGTESLAS